MLRIKLILIALLALSLTAMAHEHRYFTTSDGVRLHYTVDGNGAPIVILPGYGQCSDNFGSAVDELAKDYKIYILDYRWHGQSESPAYGAHIERLATDFKEMLNDAGIDSCYLYAHSMGNTVAWDYMSLYGQDKIKKYILGDEAPCLIPQHDWSEEEALTYTGPFGLRSTEFLAGVKAQANHADTGGEMMTRLLCEHMARDWRDVVPTIKGPTLIIMGEKSHFASPLLWNWLNANIPGSQLQTIDAGHDLHNEKPGEFCKMVREFFR